MPSCSGCTECSDCDVCDRLCATTCTERIVFEVPGVPAGDCGQQLFNAHGQTRVLDFSQHRIEATDTSVPTRATAILPTQAPDRPLRSNLSPTCFCRLEQPLA